MGKKQEIRSYVVELTYKDETTFTFEVTGHFESLTKADLMIITRGTLMASMALRATCYNKDGFDIISYNKQ